MIRNCLGCKKEQYIRPSEVKKGSRLYCWPCFTDRRKGENHPMFGKRHTIESRKKMSESNLANPRRYWLGKKFTVEHIKNNTASHIYKTGENHPMWKADDASYIAKHQWMTQWYGQPQFCEGCGTENAKRSNWANISGEYKRDRSDWIRLCRSCHTDYDDIINRGWNTRRERMVLGL